MRIVFIFAEGAHDVAFIKQVFKQCLGIKHQDSIKISSFPYPLGDFFSKQVEKNSIGDVSLDMTKKFFLPDCVFKGDSYFSLLFNTGGMNNYLYVKRVVSSILQVVKQNDSSYEFGENDIRWLFTYDSDYKSVQERQEEMSRKLFPITENDAVENNSPAREVIPKVLLDSTNSSVSFYVWSNYGKPGTLEDILINIYRNTSNDLIDNTSVFVDKHFNSDFFIEKQDEQHKSSLKAKRLKACITIAGQGKKPGRPLSAIITDNTLASNQSYLNDEYVKDFTKKIKVLIS